MNRSRTIIAAALFLTLGSAALIFGRMPKPLTGPEAGLKAPAEAPAPTSAFLNAAWGMSKAEVEAADQAVLLAPEAKAKFFTPRPSVDSARYRIYERRDVEFLGRAATVTYVFFDDKLFTYHVFVKDPDGEVLNDEMTAYLADRFGAGASEVSGKEPLRSVWQDKYLIVNYWFFHEPLTLSQKYSAGFGVVYRPIHDNIGKI